MKKLPDEYVLVMTLPLLIFGLLAFLVGGKNFMSYQISMMGLSLLFCIPIGICLDGLTFLATGKSIGACQKR